MFRKSSLIGSGQRDVGDHIMQTHSIKPALTVLEDSYRGVSPQLLARARQMWSVRGLDLDAAWRDTVGRLRGFRMMESWNDGIDSVSVDGVFMFDQALIWVASLNASAATVPELQQTQLTRQQWEAVHAVTLRMIEQLDAIRLLFLTKLSSPSMQIARSVSEDVDMVLALLSRPKLARRFVECTTVDEANEFWRRHIAGGRAFRAVSEQFYRSGLEFDQTGEYAIWRKSVMAILGTAVHTSFQTAKASGARNSNTRSAATCDCLYFVTLRLQEMCAYSHVLQKNLREDLDCVLRHRQTMGAEGLGTWTTRISEITVDQLRWSLANGATVDAPPGKMPG